MAQCKQVRPRGEEKAGLSGTLQVSQTERRREGRLFWYIASRSDREEKRRQAFLAHRKQNRLRGEEKAGHSGTLQAGETESLLDCLFVV